MPNLLDNFEDYERIIEEHENGNRIALGNNSSPTCLLALIQYANRNNLNIKGIANILEDNKPEMPFKKIENKSKSFSFTMKYYKNLDKNFIGKTPLVFILGEIYNNILDHSKFTTAYALSKKYQNMMDIVFIDDGISIPESLNRTGYCFKNDCEAIYNAINGKSEDIYNDDLRGSGLNSTINLINKGNGGSVLIASRNGLFHIDEYGKKFKELKDNYIQGTLVSMRLNKCIVKDFYDYMRYMKI